MLYHPEQEYFYYNSGEEYSDEEWEHFCNHPLTYTHHISNCIEKSGLICKVGRQAYSAHGKLLPEYFSVWTPKQLFQDEAIDKYYKIYEALGNQYEQLFYKKGIVPEGYFSWQNPCYLGCEKEYHLPSPL